MLLVARRMLAWHHNHCPGQSLSVLTGEDVLTLFGHLLGLCAADGTRSATVSYMRSFLRYLQWAGVVDCRQRPRRDPLSSVSPVPGSAR